MKLEIRGGKVVSVKNDGSLASTEPSEKSIIEFCGFPEPYGRKGGALKKVRIHAGDPVRDDLIYVTGIGTNWGSECLLSKTTGECVIIRQAEDSFARELVKNPARIEGSLEDYIEDYRQGKRDSIDVADLAGKRGLKVWVSNYIDGYWTPDYGEFEGLPQGWAFLPKGDAALSRKVRKGEYWVLLRKGKKYTEELGTLAPAENIDLAYEELGGEEGAAKRAKSKEQALEKRELTMTGNLKDAILRLYPSIPEKDLKRVLEMARRRGAVGTAQWIYFPPEGGSENAFEVAADLAVRAHVRHSYTDYDEMLPAFMDDKDARSEARRRVAGDIEEALRAWK